MSPVLRRTYRFLMRLLPPEIRGDYGDEIAAAFEAGLALERQQRAGIGRVAATLRGLADIIAFGLRARWGAWRDIAGRPSGVHSSSDPRRPPVFARDMRTAIRALRVQPASSAAIILMFALGVGATTAIFSVVNGVLLRPLPFPQPDRLVQVLGTRIDRGWSTISLTEADFWDLRDQNQTFESLGALHGASFSMTGLGLPERINAAQVSAGFFPSLGVRPVAGRLFDRGDDEPGRSETQVVLANSLWTRRFDADPNMIGRSLTLDGRSYTVIGILPPGSPWLDAGDLFVPFIRRANPDRSSFEFTAIGRIKAGVAEATALADLNRVAKQLEAAYPKSNANLGMTIRPSRAWMASDSLRRTLWTLLSAVGLLLAIACVNVTNLLLARASSRTRESAVRTALGATRGDLVRERLIESVFYGVAGGVMGLAIAYWMLGALKSINPAGIPRLAEVGLDPRAVAFATITAVIVGVLAGVVPAFWVPVGNVATTLRPSQRGTAGDRRQERLRSLLIVVEVTLSLILLIGASLLVRSLINVLSVDRGFAVDNRMLVTVSIPGTYDPPRIDRTATEVVSRVSALPQVTAAATVSGRPLTGGSTGMGIAAADRANPAEAQTPWATWRIVTQDYFKVMGLPVLAGRTLTEQDQIGKPWRVMISKRTADLLWPGANALGRTMLLWKGQNEVRGEVVGIVGDMRERGLENDPTLAVYLPAAGSGRTTLQLVVHTKDRPQDAVAAIRTVVASVDPSLPVSNVTTMEEVVSASVSTRRMTALLLGIFAAVALALALAGVYGVLSYSVARRTAEIGVRIALGADHGGVLRLVMSQGLRPVLLGGALGLAAAFWSSRLMSALLFDLQPNDPATYLTVALAVLVVATIACYIPARRVLRVDPAVALRGE